MMEKEPIYIVRVSTMPSQILPESFLEHWLRFSLLKFCCPFQCYEVCLLCKNCNVSKYQKGIKLNLALNSSNSVWSL